MIAEPRPAPSDDGGRGVAVADVHPTSAAPAAGRHGDAGEVTVEIPRAYNLRYDRLRWGPVLAGVFTTITSMVLLGLLGLAWTLTVANITTPATGAGLPSGTGRGSAIWGAISGMIAFFLGGYVAGWSAAAFDRRWGALNGAVVFFVAVPAIFWLAGSSLGLVLGNLGAFTGALNVFPNFQPLGPADFARAADGIRNAAWAALVGALLALGAAALGGMAGTRREIRVSPDQIDRLG